MNGFIQIHNGGEPTTINVADIQWFRSMDRPSRGRHCEVKLRDAAAPLGVDETYEQIVRKVDVACHCGAHDCQ